MKAEMYICVFSDGDDQSEISKIIEKHSCKFYKSRFKKNNRTIYCSDRVLFSYEDLGEKILDICSELDFPDFSKVRSEFTAFVQILVPIDDFKEFKIYLGREFLKFITEKGFGIDVHHK